MQPEDILRYDLFQGDFNKELVFELLQELTADNVCLSLVSQAHGENREFEAKVGFRAISVPWTSSLNTNTCVF